MFFPLQAAKIILMAAVYDVIFVCRPPTSFWWLQCMTNTRQWDSSPLRNTDVTPVPVFFPTRVALCECYCLCLNPFIVPVCKIAGLKDAERHVPANSIFSGPITHLLWMLCVLMKLLSRASVKKKKKKKAKGFWILHFKWSFSRNIVAVKGLKWCAYVFRKA